MAIKKPGLGRGFDALLSSARKGNIGLGVTLSPPAAQRLGSVDADNAAQGEQDEQLAGKLCQIAVTQIRPGKYQPRSAIDPVGLADLANSIREQGVIQPIVVRPIGDQCYELIAGERRWRAAQMAELALIPALVREVSDQMAIAMALIENIQRENLKPLEEALALQRLIQEFALSHEQVGQAVGRSRVAITNTLRLLDLGDYAKSLLNEGCLEVGHTRCLLGLRGALQDDAAYRVFSEGLSVRQTEKLVQDLKTQTNAQPQKQPLKPKKEAANPNIAEVQAQLSAKWGAKVDIQYTKRGKGKLVIYYNSLDEFDGILAHLMPEMTTKY